MHLPLSPGATTLCQAMTTKSKRGFASMDPEKQRAVASKGGKSAHERGNAHEFTAEGAREAGSKGGRAVAKNREHMAEIRTSRRSGSWTETEGGRRRGRMSQGGIRDGRSVASRPVMIPIAPLNVSQP